MPKGDALVLKLQKVYLGFLLVHGTNQPYRVKLRAPGFVHLSAMERITKGHQLADVSAILGSLDIVFGRSIDNAQKTCNRPTRKISVYKIKPELGQSSLKKYPKGRQASAVIPLLWKVQEQEGWAPKPAIEYVANF